MIEKSHFSDNKYSQVGRWLQEHRGPLLDVGARDRILQSHLGAAGLIEYASADVGAGCDFQIDLEKPLPFEDGAYNHVVALDVLEHVEHAQAAFAELARVSRQTLIIALPNMATLTRRLKFLTNGHFGTAKYTFSATHPGDRHRWLTVYRDILPFAAELAERHNLQIAAQADEVLGGKLRPLAKFSYACGASCGGSMAERVLLLFTKR